MSDVPGFDALARHAVVVHDLGIRLDLSTLPVSADLRASLAPRFARAFADMAALEAGAIANPDEGRMVGHYWLRAPDLAPDPALRAAIDRAREDVEAFGAAVRSGAVSAPGGARFAHLVVCGIGGSGLGPQLAADALGATHDPLDVRFLDNTDPEGIARVLTALGDGLARTLFVVISKSGGTPETRNGLEEVRAHLAAAGLDPARQLVAVTGEGSAMERRARAEGWLAIFPMWDWVGGRTSQTSAVGLLPMAILGHDIDGLLDGARAMDAATRVADLALNPEARLAEGWYAATGGAGRRDMVVLPYKDRLILFSRYLQQLVMESLGKEHDLAGRTVRQGIAVYGNKGSTDQHAYVQQLRDGVDNFFALLIGVEHDGGAAAPLEVEPGVTSGDYLTGFLLGTRRALAEKGRLVATLTVPRVDARTLGALIALFERTVGLYALLVGINAYHQPGVEAGKKAAAAVLALQKALLESMAAAPGELLDAPGWAARAGRPADAVEALIVLEHLAANPARGVRREGPAGAIDARFGV